jgi:hypothetical protein
MPELAEEFAVVEEALDYAEEVLDQLWREGRTTKGINVAPSRQALAYIKTQLERLQRIEEADFVERCIEANRRCTRLRTDLIEGRINWEDAATEYAKATAPLAAAVAALAAEGADSEEGA